MTLTPITTAIAAAAALLFALPAAGLAPAPARARPPAKPMLSKSDRASFLRLERALGGRSGVAVAPLGVAQPVRSAGRLRTAVGWSTSKVPVAMAVVAGGRPGQAANLRAAITASDNAAAERLWSSLGEPATAAAKAPAQLRVAGDARTTVQARRLRAGFSAFGQTDWRLRDQARFAAGMPCSSQGRAVLALMAKVQPGQRWGLGSAGVPAKFKGGWGPGTRPGSGGGYVDRQLGIVRVANRSFAVSIATAPRDGSHATGTAHLTRIARWVVAHVDADTVARASICG